MVPCAEGARIQKHTNNKFQAWYPLMGPPDSKTFRWGDTAEFNSESAALAAVIKWMNAQHDACQKKGKRAKRTHPAC